MDSIREKMQALRRKLGIPVPAQPPAAPPIVISFCTGAMGLDLGLERAGFKLVLAAETDPDALATIRANRLGLPVLGDICQYTAAQVRTAAGIGDKYIDVIAFGPPCQTYSIAGKGQGLDDPRGMVLLACVALAIELNPQFIVVENVPRLVAHHAFNRILGMFRDADYAVSYGVYNAACFGAAQKRKRLIIIASRDGRQVPPLTPTHSNCPQDGLPAWRTLRDAIGDLVDLDHHHARYSPKRLKYWRQLAAGQNWRYLRDPMQALGAATFVAAGGKSGYYRRLAWSSVAPTLLTDPANFYSGCCHPERDRPLSIEEYKRLQGFPDTWELCGNLQSRYRQVGNAVPVHLGEAVGLAILQHMRIRNSSEKRSVGDTKGIERHGARYSQERLKYWMLLKAGQDGRHLHDLLQAMGEANIAAVGKKTCYYKRLSWDVPAPTLVTKPGAFRSGCCHPTEHRPLSVPEYKRLQGFPDDWQICGSVTRQYEQLGNAVPVPLGEAVGKTILRHMRIRSPSEERPGQDRKEQHE